MNAEHQGPLYSIVAWPSAELGEWLAQLQRHFGVRSYGEAHLNLRAPFGYVGSEKELTAQVRSALDGVSAFEVKFLRWRRFPHVVFLEYALSDQLLDLHQRLLNLPGVPRGGYNGKDYIPHVSLAVGLCPWAEDSVWRRLQTAKLPQQTFEVTAASLTREVGGELREVHTFPLLQPGDEDTEVIQRAKEAEALWSDAGSSPLA